MRTNLLTAIREIPRLRGFATIVGCVLIGLALARFMMASPTAAILVLAGGIVLSSTMLLRRIDFLIYAWFVLTGFILLIIWRLVPQYASFLGTAIFWGLLGCVIAAWAMDNVLSGRQFIRFDNVPIKVVIFLFLLWGTISVYTSVNLDVSIRRFSHIVIGLGASYMFYDFFSRDQRNIKRTVAVIFFMTLVVSVATIVTAVYSLASGIPIYKQLGLWLMGSNAVGSLLCYSIPILLTAGLSLISARNIRFVLVAVMLLALYLSYARTSWIGTLAAIVFILWKSGMKRPMWFTIVTGLIIVALLLPVRGEDFYQYITGPRYSGRQEIWKASWNMACDNPLFGVGPGNAARLMPEYLADPISVAWIGFEDTHSVYLKNAAEMGFASAVMGLFVIAIFLYNSIKIERNLKSEFLRLVCRGATATFLGLLFHGLAENGTFLTPFAAGEFFVMLPYIVLAMPFAAKKLEESEK